MSSLVECELKNNKTQTREPMSKQVKLNPVFKSPALNSQTFAAKKLAEDMRKDGKKVFKMGFGECVFKPPMVMVDALKNSSHFNKYETIAGSSKLRENVCKWHKHIFETNYLPEYTVCCNGTKPLFGFLMTALDCTVMIVTPAWVTYNSVATIYKGEKSIQLVHTRAEDEFLLTKEVLKKSLDSLTEEQKKKEKLLILNYPSNPTGATYSIEQFKELAGVLRENGVIVLCDEIYSMYTDPSIKKASLAKVYPEGCIITTGVSKFGAAGGWRLGVGLFPKELADLYKCMLVIISNVTSCSSVPIQNASITCFDHTNKEMIKYFDECAKVYDKVRKVVYNFLKKETKLILANPKGAFYIYPCFSNYREALKKHGVNNSDDLSVFLLKKIGLSTVSGSSFCRGEKHLGTDELGVRIALCSFEDEASHAKDVVDNVEFTGKDEDYVNTECGDTMEAMRALAEMLKNL